MNIKKLEPIKAESQESLDRINQATQSQSVSNAQPRTLDPNHKLFRFVTNDKHLVYVPNFYTEDEEGNKSLQVEAPYVHAVNYGRQFMQFRATQGMQGLEEFGISGNSPLFEAVQEGWELYNLKYKMVAEQMNVDPNNDVGDVLKPKRQELLNERVVKDADASNRRYYFPIVLFETKKDAKTGLNTFEWVLGDDDMPKYEIQWMDVSQSQWDEKWAKLADSLDDGDCVAGKLLSLNYHFTDDISSEKNPRRDSGRNLNINIRPQKTEHAEFFKYLDGVAKDYTPAKAREVIVACALLSDEQQQGIVDEVMQESRMELASLKNLNLGIGQQNQQQLPTQGNQTPDNALANFGGVQEQSNADAGQQGGQAQGQEQNAGTEQTQQNQNQAPLSFGS